MAHHNSHKKIMVKKQLQIIADGLAERGSIPQDWSQDKTLGSKKTIHERNN
jgi:hypothetical protein